MIHEKFTITGIDEMVYHLTLYKDKTDWQIDFYNIYGALLLSFDSDEETLHRLKDEEEAYRMVTEWMDVALMMGKEW
ncbi:hypothetical protein [Anaerotignum sp. MB30-C6]|uniref:hypothetical protein n=1 Tax=Anaerotignum sp. MB30-C6 TaxID=3070814 RepID=UPI0027DC9578|nr:hypothetical protein [Anaerotignum sp. MB30-C6]WMI81203.1 hypothetical protein RBQ60_00290 [Anaerotignum sp. MB30-C6]